MPPRSADNSSLALDRIRALIDGAADSGDGKLPTERALSDTLGVSRRSVRRALQVLEAEGLVWRRQGSGTYAVPQPGTRRAEPVAQPGEVDFMEVMEVRLRVEPQLAQLAALRAGPEALTRMRRLVDRIAAQGDSDSRELWDSALHREIARSAGNRFFLAIFETIDRVRHDEAWRRVREQARNSGLMRTYTRQHRAIVEAIAERDPQAAGAAMREHLMSLYDSIVRQTSMEGLSNVS